MLIVTSAKATARIKVRGLGKRLDVNIRKERPPPSTNIVNWIRVSGPTMRSSIVIFWGTLNCIPTLYGTFAKCGKRKEGKLFLEE